MKVKFLSDENVFEGKDPAEVVTKMRDFSAHLRHLTIEEYMREVKEWCDDEKINTESCEKFILSLEKEGYVVRL